jgi:hypothetical protein
MGPVRRQRWHLDEVLGTIKGVTPFLWRVVDPQGHVLESPVTKTRDVWQVSRSGWRAGVRTTGEGRGCRPKLATIQLLHQVWRSIGCHMDNVG